MHFPIKCITIFDSKELIGKSKIIHEIKEFVIKVAKVDHPVLILGETGVGKTFVAQLIHSVSPRREKPCLHQSCSNIPDTLFESELFGYEKGSFTGAIESKIGKIERAKGGTLFLDEISNLAFQNQAKLNLFVEAEKFFKLGGTEENKGNVRIICASNKDLKKEIEKGRFRKDLYYRISTLELYIPPLRERKEDIPLLVESFIRRESLEQGREINISQEALTKLSNYTFPGNVRELENVMKRAFTLSEGDLIKEVDIPFEKGAIEKKYIKKTSFTTGEIINTLVKNKGNKTKAAKELKISRGYLHFILKKLNNKIITEL